MTQFPFVLAVHYAGHMAAFNAFHSRKAAVEAFESLSFKPAPGEVKNLTLYKGCFEVVAGGLAVNPRGKYSVLDDRSMIGDELDDVEWDGSWEF